MFQNGYQHLSPEVATKYRHKDSLHILPLHCIPLQTSGLKQACLIKNAKMETVVELFRGRESGSGQVYIDALPKAFPSYADQLKNDIPVLSSLAKLPSFDVYSLRIDLRRLGIDVDHESELTLSPVKRQELSAAMTQFTRPLIHRIYGGDNNQIYDLGDLIKLFTAPDRAEAMRNLQKMAETLKVNIQDIPQFIEEYGDVFLSLAYYQRGLEDILPDVEVYVGNVRAARSNYQLKSDKSTMQIFDYIERTMQTVVGSLASRLDSFQGRFKGIWQTIDYNSFQEIKRLITSNHRSLGGVLCGLAVKINLWEERFPNGTVGISTLKEFSRGEIYPGLELLRSMEEQAAIDANNSQQY